MPFLSFYSPLLLFSSCKLLCHKKWEIRLPTFQLLPAVIMLLSRLSCKLSILFLVQKHEKGYLRSRPAHLQTTKPNQPKLVRGKLEFSTEELWHELMNISNIISCLLINAFKDPNIFIDLAAVITRWACNIS